MEITPGRAMYSPDEELKPLRQPKTYHTEAAPAPSTLSINAAEFVPRFSGNAQSVQERLQKHQRQYLQKNYHQYQPQEQTQQHQQYQQQHQSYSNGFNNPQHEQQYQQTSQNINSQMGGLSISRVQDRLRTGNNSAGRASESGTYYFQQQQQQQQQQHRGNGGYQQDYHHNNQYRFNKNHNNHHQQQQQPHHHNRFNNQNHNQQSQQQQQQQFHQQNQQQSSNASALAENANDMENIALDYLQSVIHCLNQNPGQFDSVATRFNFIYEGMENNHFVMSIAMEEIFDESIRNPNFRYMGAKLYNLLHTLNPNKDSLFLTMLKLKLDYHQEQVREYIQTKQEAKVRETALFLAELYMQLRGDVTRNNLIAENIVFSLKELLSLEDSKDNIRCICLTLKLAGYDLSSDCPTEMREIITKLDAINCQNPGKYPLANNVISLQKNNWGRKSNSTAMTQAEAQTPKHIEPLRDSDDPVFYGPDGHVITAEECEFLTSGTIGTATSSDNDEEIDDVDLDPEMDEETERDFKLFLKQANNKS